MRLFVRHRNGVRQRTAAAPKRQGRHVLLVVALLLAASGAVRVGGLAGRAFAETAAPDEGEAAQAECTPSAGALDMLKAAQAREDIVVSREKAVEERERAVALASERLEARLAELVKAEEALARTISIADEAAEKDIVRLVAVYEAMKPKDAAPVFTAMAPDFAAGFLARMRPDAAAAILAGLEPERAYAISAVLAGRNAAAPTD
jgi:flagellar motility protein MotE (MotC chaperone)